ncbi:MAG: hypothetical protein KBD63_02685 [Bacteriovoracaceae bacterium]|nr:hypothetical protein [Bacteriovoracaceae bacterium]
MEREVVRNELEQKFFELCNLVVQEQGLCLYDLFYNASSALLRLFIMNKKTGTALIEDCVKVDSALSPYFE